MEVQETPELPAAVMNDGEDYAGAAAALHDDPEALDRLLRASEALQGVHAELSCIRGPAGRGKIDGWGLLQVVGDKWGATEAATAKVQALLQSSASAIADVISLPKPLLTERAAEVSSLKFAALSNLQLLYYLDHSIRVSAIATRLARDLSRTHLDLAVSVRGSESQDSESQDSESQDSESQGSESQGSESRARAPKPRELKLPEISDEEISAGLARFSCMEKEADLNKFQTLVIFLLNQAYIRGYKRYAGDVYERKLVDGRDTRAWRKVSSIKDFIFDVTRKEVNFAQWCNLTANISNANSAAEYLTTCRDIQFKDLAKNRHVFAFRNGIYVTAEDRFYDSTGAATTTQSDAHASEYLGQEDVAACKFFDLDFVDHAPGDWFAIPTPHLQSVLSHQGYDEHVSRWMYVFIGRLLYEVGVRDGWQVIPFFKGQAGTGKSTLLMKVCSNFFEADDVGVLSNNIERKFGLSAIVDKLVFVAPEIKGDLQMEQAEFQSVVSGEACQINIKYKKAETIARWKVPGVLAGNEAPNWVDNAGSVSRRMVVFEFGRRVEDADMELGSKLSAEMPAILQKCNRAYLDAVAKYRKDSLWKHLPAYFHQTKQDLVENVNSLESFLASGEVIKADGAYMRWKEFKVLYIEYCSKSNLPQLKINKDFKDRLQLHGLRENKQKRLLYPRNVAFGCMTFDDYLMGCDLRSAFYGDDDDDDAVDGRQQRVDEPDCGGDF